MLLVGKKMGCNASIKLSIIIPIYNVEKWLEECLDSVFSQYRDDIEIILINDGSTDQSLKIAERYYSKEKNIQLIDQPNRGLGAARNVGIQRAQGEYLFFIDSDDYIKENAIIKILHVISKYPEVDCLLLNYTEFEDESNKILKEKFLKHDYKRIENGAKILCETFQNKEYISGAQFHIVKRKLLRNKKVRFDEGVIHEDEGFSFDVMVNSVLVYILVDPIYFYRIRKNSIMQKNSYQKSFSGYAVELIRMLKNNADQQEKYINDGIIKLLVERWNFINDNYWKLEKNKENRKLYQNVKFYIKKNNYFHSLKVYLECKIPFIYKVYYWVKK